MLRERGGFLLKMGGFSIKDTCIFYVSERIFCIFREFVSKRFWMYFDVFWRIFTMHADTLKYVKIRSDTAYLDDSWRYAEIRMNTSQIHRISTASEDTFRYVMIRLNTLRYIVSGRQRWIRVNTFQIRSDTSVLNVFLGDGHRFTCPPSQAGACAPPPHRWSLARAEGDA